MFCCRFLLTNDSASNNNSGLTLSRFANDVNSMMTRIGVSSTALYSTESTTPFCSSAHKAEQGVDRPGRHFRCGGTLAAWVSE